MNRSLYIITLAVYKDIRSSRGLVFAFILALYLASVLASTSLMVLIYVDTTLHNPMFIFLFSLICNGLIGCTAVWPSVMGHLVTGFDTVSYEGCLAQSFFITAYVGCTYMLMVLMAFDRYVCIFQPLRYHTVMEPRRLKGLLFVANLLPVTISFGQTCLISDVPLCQFIIHNLFCGPRSVSDLGCSQGARKHVDDVYSMFVIAFLVLIVFLIILSYLKIFALSSRLSADGRKKAFTTCIPHIIIFLTFSLSMPFFFIFDRVSNHNDNLPVVVVLLITFLYILFPPLIHPIIYGIKKQEIRQSFSKYLKSTIVFRG